MKQLPYKVITLKLFYRGSIHGWCPKKFHELCDEKGPTLTIMKSLANKIFGGFAM